MPGRRLTSPPLPVVGLCIGAAWHLHWNWPCNHDNHLQVLAVCPPLVLGTKLGAFIQRWHPTWFHTRARAPLTVHLFIVLQPRLDALTGYTLQIVFLHFHALPVLMSDSTGSQGSNHI